MASSRTSYMLKRFTSANDPDFAAALMVYVRNTPANIRTETNEIAYWLDQYSKRFGDFFYVFGFYRDRKIVGYAEAAYFNSERLIVIDYITIEEAYRQNNVFFEFVDHLKRHLEQAHPEYHYGVAEVTYGSGQQYPSQISRLTTRLLKLQGFQVIHAPYFQPRLIAEDAETEMQADLLIYSTAERDRIQASTYLSIVHTLYYKYYLRWKSVIPDPGGKYQKHLDELYSKIKASVGKKKIILLNGHKTILTTSSRRPVVSMHRIVSFSAQALAVVVLLTAAMLGLKSAFGLSNTAFLAIYVFAISSFVAVAGIVSKEARKIFAEFVSLAKFFYRRRTDGLKPTEQDQESSSPSDQTGP